MGKKTKSKKDIVSYRNKHYIAIAAVICITIAQIFALEGFWKVLVYAGFAFVVGTLVGTYEEKDELTNETLLKATEFTFIIVLGALFISAIVVENFKEVTDTTQLTIDLFYYILLGSVAVRSLIFLILDRAPTGDDEEDEEIEETEEVISVEEEEKVEEKSEAIDIEKLKEELKSQLREELKEEFKNESKIEEVIEETVEEVVEETVEDTIEEIEESEGEEIKKEPKPKTAKTKKARMTNA